MRIDTSIPAEVVTAFGLDGPTGDPITGGRVSKVWRVSRAGRAVALRKSPFFRQFDEVGYECDLLARLRRAGGPIAAPVSGPLMVDGSAWVAFDWADGSHPVMPVDDPAIYGRLLAQLHALTDTTSTKIGQRPGWGRLDEFRTLPRGSQQLTLETALPDFERAQGTAGTTLRRAVDVVHERLQAADPENLPTVTAHGDFSPRQVLVHDDGSVSAVVDWDFCHIDLRLADLAIASSLSRPTAERAARMLRGYLHAADVEVGDLSLLSDLRRAFHLNNLANYVCAVWANGGDVTPQVNGIIQRLEHEQWWGPTLLSAAQDATRSTPPTTPSKPVTRDSSDLEIAHELADRAAVVGLQYFATGVVAETKDDATPVTEADHAIERMLRDALGELRPDDAVLGEELGGVQKGQRTWILDPIDGTAAFARGDPHWRVQIALEEDAAVTVAVVDVPAQATRWWATAGGGTYERNGTPAEPRRLTMAPTASVAGALVAAHPPAIGARLPSSVRQPPPTPLPLVELIRGEIDAYFVQCCHPWDHAPWILLVQEAGGAFTDHHGGATPYHRGGLYSTAALHQALQCVT